eukprot:ctg_1754.g518
MTQVNVLQFVPAVPRFGRTCHTDRHDPSVGAPWRTREGVSTFWGLSAKAGRPRPLYRRWQCTLSESAPSTRARASRSRPRSTDITLYFAYGSNMNPRVLVRGRAGGTGASHAAAPCARAAFPGRAGVCQCGALCVQRRGQGRWTGAGDGGRAVGHAAGGDGHGAHLQRSPVGGRNGGAQSGGCPCEPRRPISLTALCTAGDGGRATLWHRRAVRGAVASALGCGRSAIRSDAGHFCADRVAVGALLGGFGVARCPARICAATPPHHGRSALRRPADAARRGALRQTAAVLPAGTGRHRPQPVAACARAAVALRCATAGGAARQPRLDGAVGAPDVAGDAASAGRAGDDRHHHAHHRCRRRCRQHRAGREHGLLPVSGHEGRQAAGASRHSGERGYGVCALTAGTGVAAPALGTGSAVRVDGVPGWPAHGRRTAAAAGSVPGAASALGAGLVGADPAQSHAAAPPVAVE